MSRVLKKIAIFLLIVGLVTSLTMPHAQADLPVVDFVNAALNEFRNTIIQNQFVQEIVVFFDQLEALQSTYEEIVHFHSGIEDFIRKFLNEGTRAFHESQTSFRENYLSVLDESPEVDAIRNLGHILEGNGDPFNIPHYLKVIHGADPGVSTRPDITFDEIQVGEAYLMAHEVRKRSNEVRMLGENIQDLAQTASPKGAARLTSDALGKMIVLSQAEHDLLAKLLEVEGARLEQVNRDEKRFEFERLQYMNEIEKGVEAFGRFA